MSALAKAIEKVGVTAPSIDGLPAPRVEIAEDRREYNVRYGLEEGATINVSIFHVKGRFITCVVPSWVSGGLVTTNLSRIRNFPAKDCPRYSAKRLAEHVAESLPMIEQFLTSERVDALIFEAEKSKR